MKKVLLVIALMMMSFHAVYAEGYTGNEFVNQWQEYKKLKAGQSYDVVNLSYYMGYVNGIAHAGQFIGWFSWPDETTEGQLNHVVGKWIDDHPERWADSPLVIVTTALKEAFPLRKRK